MLRSAAPIVKGLTLTSTRRFSVISVADSAAGGSTTGDVGTYPPFLPDEDDPAMSHDDALPELVDSSDDDEDGDEDVPLEDVPDLVDSSDDDAALETSMNVD